MRCLQVDERVLQQRSRPHQFIYHIELADGGTLKLGSLARRAFTWHFGYEDLVLIALDPEIQGRSANLGTKQLSKGDPDLTHYLGRPINDPAEDIELVVYSYTDNVRRRVLREKLKTSLGGAVTRWKSDKRTKGLRVFVVLYLGGCCRAFDLPRYTPREDNKDAERFLRYFRQLVVRFGQNPDADFKPFAPEDFRDNTINLEAEGVRDEVNTGPVRIHSRLLSIPAIPSRAPMLIEKRTALIVVAQIALLRPRLEGGHQKPYVISLVLANGFGRVLAIFDSGPQEAVMPAGVSDHENGTPQSTRCARRSSSA